MFSFSLDINGKPLRQHLYELKVKTNTLRHDLGTVKRMQQSLQETFKAQLDNAYKKIEVNHRKDQEECNYQIISSRIRLCDYIRQRFVQRSAVALKMNWTCTRSTAPRSIETSSKITSNHPSHLQTIAWLLQRSGSVCRRITEWCQIETLLCDHEWCGKFCSGVEQHQPFLGRSQR